MYYMLLGEDGVNKEEFENADMGLAAKKMISLKMMSLKRFLVYMLLLPFPLRKWYAKRGNCWLLMWQMLGRLGRFLFLNPHQSTYPNQTVQIKDKDKDREPLEM